MRHIIWKTLCIFTIGCIVLFSMNILFSTSSVVADKKLDEETPNVLVVFSSMSDEIDEHQRMLDMLLGHFTDRITFISESLVNERDLEDADYLFYYGHQKKQLPSTFVDIISNFTGVTVAIGYNIEQLGDRYSFLNQLPNKAVIDKVHVTDDVDNNHSFVPQLIFNIELEEEQQVETLLTGKKGSDEHPVFVRKGTDYYLATHIVKHPFSISFAEMLHVVFEEDHQSSSKTNPGYLRLEDIHPLVDPEHMMNIAKILKEKDIPYMIAVIPVYTNPETQKQYHFSDSPKLLKALKYMQDNGGSIVLHGYTHQFRLSETGEGFEFWDVEHNMPIYHDQDDEVIVKTEKNFDSKDEYEQYLSGQLEYERDYIQDRLKLGIQELVTYGLYPLAFEAPHYTMSQHGYEVTSEYFNTYVGQLQISDKDWEVMTTSPYMTNPTFLHGMKLLPETIGYVKPENPDAIEEMLNEAHDHKFVRDGMVAGFYHPYLGVDLFMELIEEMEKVPNVSWINLKEMENHVRAEHVDIRTEKGEIITNISHTGLLMTSKEYVNYNLNVFIERLFWFIAGLGFLGIVTFVINIFINSHKKENKMEGI